MPTFGGDSGGLWWYLKFLLKTKWYYRKLDGNAKSKKKSTYQWFYCVFFWQLKRRLRFALHWNHSLLQNWFCENNVKEKLSAYRFSNQLCNNSWWSFSTSAPSWLYNPSQDQANHTSNCQYHNKMRWIKNEWQWLKRIHHSVIIEIQHYLSTQAIIC